MLTNSLKWKTKTALHHTPLTRVIVDSVPTSAVRIDASYISPSVHPSIHLTPALLDCCYGNWESEPGFEMGFVHKITTNPIHMDLSSHRAA